MPAVCLLCEFVGCRQQAERQLKAVLELPTHGQGVVLRVASTPALCWLWIN